MIPLTKATTSQKKRRTPLHLMQKKYAGVFRHPVHGDFDVEKSKSGDVILRIGRVGNAVVQCLNSTTVCSLKFEGIVWYLSDSLECKEANTTIIFKTDGKGYVRKVLMPMFYAADPPAFEKTTASSTKTRAVDNLREWVLSHLNVSKHVHDFK